MRLQVLDYVGIMEFRIMAFRDFGILSFRMSIQRTVKISSFEISDGSRNFYKELTY
jgi:hypothetical protein